MTTARSRPPAFARYIASSAHRNRSDSVLSGPERQTAVPMLTVTIPSGPGMAFLRIRKRSSSDSFCASLNDISGRSRKKFLSAISCYRQAVFLCKAAEHFSYRPEAFIACLMSRHIIIDFEMVHIDHHSCCRKPFLLTAREDRKHIYLCTVAIEKSGKAVRPAVFFQKLSGFAGAQAQIGEGQQKE